MSHFTVLVVSDTKPTYESLTAQLLPFHEYECTGIEEYVQFIPKDMVEAQQEYTENGAGDSFDEFMRGWYGASQNEAGVWGRRTNPNKKWDWWAVGGRWKGTLVDADGRPADCVQKRNLDLDAMALARTKRRADTWRTFEADLANGRDAHLSDFLYGIPNGMDKETFLATDPGFTTFAVLMGGEWYEKGHMGWFATVSNEQPDWPQQFAALFATIPDTAWLTMVDCHI